ncbi:MAG: response regulator [Kiritimatiellae bacterium]|nr:response regulator [Kiritimatiellia bacterium]
MSEAGQRRILVTDDDAGIRAVVRRALEEHGYTVEEAANGVECLRRVREWAPDLVILDLYMPEKDGLETLRELRAMRPMPRLITMSGGGPTYDMTILQSARFLGAESALLKPFTIADLLEVVRRMLEVPAEPGAGGSGA